MGMTEAPIVFVFNAAQFRIEHGQAGSAALTVAPLSWADLRQRGATV